MDSFTDIVSVPRAISKIDEKVEGLGVRPRVLVKTYYFILVLNKHSKGLIVSLFKFFEKNREENGESELL